MADANGLAAGGDGNGSEGNPSGSVGDRLGSIFGNGATVIDPAEVGTGGSSSDSSGDAPKRRGRKPGSKNKTTNTTVLDLTGVEKLLVTITAILAGFTKAPEWELDEASAKKIAEATARCARHYPVLDKIGDKAIDHVNLLSVVGGEAGLRVIAWKMRKATERAARSDAPPSNVTQMPYGLGR